MKKLEDVAASPRAREALRDRLARQLRLTEARIATLRHELLRAQAAGQTGVAAQIRGLEAILAQALAEAARLPGRYCLSSRSTSSVTRFGCARRGRARRRMRLRGSICPTYT